MSESPEARARRRAERLVADEWGDNGEPFDPQWDFAAGDVAAFVARLLTDHEAELLRLEGEADEFRVGANKTVADLGRLIDAEAARTKEQREVANARLAAIATLEAERDAALRINTELRGMLATFREMVDACEHDCEHDDCAFLRREDVQRACATGGGTDV